MRTFCLRRTGTPEYLYAELPFGRTLQYGLRNKREYDVPLCKTDRSLSTYFANALHEWNLLDKSVIISVALAELKRKLLTAIRPVKSSMFEVSDMCGAKKLTMLRLHAVA